MNDHIIIFFFRFLNFAILIAIGHYLWKQYGQLMLYEHKEHKEDYLKALDHTYTAVKKEYHLLKEDMHGQERDRTYLKEQLFAWRDAVFEKNKYIELMKKKRIDQLATRLKEQIARSKEYELYHSVKKDALDDVKKKLTQQFSSESAQHAFVKVSIKKMGNI